MKKKYELQQEINAKSERLSALFAAGGADYDLTEDQVSEIRQANDELTDLGKQLDAIVAQEKDLGLIREQQIKAFGTPQQQREFERPAGRVAQDEAPKSIGDRFVGAAEYARHKGVSRPLYGVNFDDVDPKEMFYGHEQKTTMTTAAGYAAVNARTGQVVLSAQRRLSLLRRHFAYLQALNADVRVDFALIRLIEVIKPATGPGQ